jgi:hypothetical protein
MPALVFLMPMPSYGLNVNDPVTAVNDLTIECTIRECFMDKDLKLLNLLTFNAVNIR